jgi:hypothetical protein
VGSRRTTWKGYRVQLTSKETCVNPASDHGGPQMRWPDSFATLAPDLSMHGLVLGEMRSLASHGTGAKLQMAEPAPSSGALPGGVPSRTLSPEISFPAGPRCLARLVLGWSGLTSYLACPNYPNCEAPVHLRKRPQSVLRSQTFPLWGGVLFPRTAFNSFRSSSS